MRGVPTATRVSSGRRQRPTLQVLALLTALVAAFSKLWIQGAVVLDGQGATLYARLLSDYLIHRGRIPYWIPEVWSGTPGWALAPSFPLMLLLPLTSMAGPDVALKVGVLAFQVIGGLGAYVLARSLWGRGPGPVLAGIFYALHPMIVSHGALVGLEPILGVTAATPWLMWSFRLALLGGGRKYVVVGALSAAFAVLHQAEYALCLPLMCGFMLLVELAHSREDPVHGTPGQVLKRAGAIVGLGLALCAFWLLPLGSLRNSFVLSPPELVQAELTGGTANLISNNMGTFFNRPGSITGVVSHQRPDLVPPLCYLGLVCAAMTMVTLFLLPRRDRDGHLTAIMAASGMAVWFSTGSVPLIASGPSLRHQVVPLAIAGVGTGLLVAAFVRQLRLRRFHVVAVVAAVALLLAVPFVTPYTGLQKVIPLFAVIRFPRFYTLAALGLSLGGAYPVAVLARRAAEGFRLPPLLPAALAVGLAIAFLVDIVPYRTLYEVRPPESAAAYKEAVAALPKPATPFRVAPGRLEPGATGALLQNGLAVTSGWPHPFAGRQLWRVSGEPYVGPAGFREAAFGLSATSYIAVERVEGVGGPNQTVTEVVMARNPRSLPFVRAYEQAVVVDDPALAPLMATGLAYRNIAVITRREPVADLVAGMPTVTVGRDQSCARPSLAELGAASGVVATACALDPWLSAVLAGVEFVPADKRPGAVFTAQAGGLRGIAVWLDRSPGTTEMRLYEVAPDGRTLGAAVATAQAVGLDEVGLAAFAFDPIVDSAGKRYAFSLSCDGCAPAEVPLMYSGVVTDGGGNFTVGNDQRVDRVAAFVPVHDEIPPATTPHTVIQAENPDPGSWRIAADGPNPVLLVVAETWFPGWSATVDGKSTPVLQADGAFLGVAVPAGAHTVTLDFRRPVSGVVGRVITAITLIVLVIGYWLRPGPRRERPARGPRRGRRSPSAARDSDADADAEPDERDRPDLDWEEAVAPSRPRPQSGSVSGSSSGSSPGGASASG